MASIRRQRDACEIRECVPTDRGPRQRPLARFRGALTPEVLDEAEARATRPFDRAALTERARRLGIPVRARRRHPNARRLLGRLQRGGDLDPTLVGLLRDALARLDARAVPEHLADAADWIGRPERERGRALRGLVRTADRIVRSRGRLRDAPSEVFPRFSSRDHEPVAAHAPGA